MLTSITAIVGVVLGIASLTLGIFNYLRDRPRVRIHLQWGMQEIGGPPPPDDREFGVVSIANTGRRPVYISHLHLMLTKKLKTKRLVLITSSVPGRKLSEGDPPAIFKVPPEIQARYAQDLNKIRARASDSAGQTYTSKYPAVPEAQQAINTK